MPYFLWNLQMDDHAGRLDIRHVVPHDVLAVRADGTKGVLASANGKDVVWYDVTDIESASVIIHLQVP